MAGLLRGLVRGVLVGGLVALLWRVLGNREGRVSASGFLVEKARGVPFVGSQLYAAAIGTLMDGVYRAVAEDATSEARSGELMELGSGAGYLAVEIAKRARDLQITTMELLPHLTYTAESRIHAAGLGKQVKVALGEAEDVPFLDESYDYVVSLGYLHRWDDPEKVLGEVHRLLKPGGKAWIYDFRSDMPEEGWDLVRERLDPLMRPVFDGIVVAQWREALTEGQIQALVARSPFGQAEVGVKTVEVGGTPAPALTKVVLEKN